MTTHLVNVFTDTPTSYKGTATCEYYEDSQLIKWSQGGHQVPDGYAVFFRCQPNTGYLFDYWLLATTGAKIYTPSFDQTITGFFGATAFFKPLAPDWSNVTISKTGEGSTDPPIGNYPSTYKVGDDLYVTATPWLASSIMQRNGVNWTSSNPGGFLNLQATENINVVFEEAPPGKGVLEVHAYEDGSEVGASVEIVGVGTRATPFVEVLDPGSYGLSVTFKGAVKTDTVVIVASETTKVDYRYAAPPKTWFDRWWEGVEDQFKKLGLPVPPKPPQPPTGP